MIKTKSINRPTRVQLVLADRSVRLPEGMLESILVRIGEIGVLTDFVINIKEDPTDPLLFGRPLLATAGAIINVPKAEIQLNLGKNFQVTFNINDIMGKPDIDEQVFWIDFEEMDSFATDFLKDFEEEDRLQAALVSGKDDEDLDIVSREYRRLMDSHKPVEGLVEQLRRRVWDAEEKVVCAVEGKIQTTNGDWSELLADSLGFCIYLSCILV